MAVQMLWRSTSDRSIQSAISQLQSQAYLERKQSAEEAERFRYSSGIDHLEADPGESPLRFAARKHMTIDVLEFLLKALCQTYIYEGGPKRVWEFPNAEAERIWHVFEGDSTSWEDTMDLFGERDSLTETCSYLEQDVEYHGTILVKLHPTRFAPVAVSFSPHQFDVILNTENPRKVDVVRLLMNDKKDYLFSFERDPDYKEIYEVWSREFFCRVDESGQLLSPVQPNPYGAIPVVALRRIPSYKSFFCPGLSDSLIDFCKALNTLTDSVYRIAKHAHGQIVLTGKWEKKPRFVGPDSPWDAGMGDAHALQLANNLPDLLKTWTELLQNKALALGISPGLVLKELYLTGGDRSGASFEIARRGPLDGQIQKQGQWKKNERRIVNMGALVQAKTMGRPIEAVRPTSLHIVFPETRRTPQDKREDARMELELGIRELWQVAMERDPSLTKEKAKEQVANAAKTKKLSVQPAPSVV